MKFLCVSNDETLTVFAKALAEQGEVESVTTSAAAMEKADGEKYAAVCVGESLEDGSGMEFAHAFARRFPLTNCALVSGMEHDAFHEATEGLGLVMQIAPNPDAAEAKRLLDILHSINSLF